MATSKRPRVILASVAQHHAMEDERIIEVSSDGGGCLITMRVIDGRLRIHVYRDDATVDVCRFPMAGVIFTATSVTQDEMTAVAVVAQPMDGRRIVRSVRSHLAPETGWADVEVEVGPRHNR